ncbi:MAG: DUF4147 domain-containing protein [Leptospira sp.]|nr:DUF4147 domain-containing protein [Leptospira sp.]
MKELLSSIFHSGIESSLPNNCFLNISPPKSCVSFVSIGKAGYAMAEAFIDLYKKAPNKSTQDDEEKSPEGLVITKYAHAKGQLPHTKVLESSHPIPNEDSLNAGEELIQFLANVKTEHVVFLISGGGSSLVEKPVKGESLESIQELTASLLASGKPIQEVNTYRTSKSQFKGGKLLNFLPKNVKKVTNYIISDVLGDNLSSISSGMTIPCDATEFFTRESISYENHILGGNSIALKSCLHKSQSFESNYHHKNYILNSRMEGEAREIGKFISQIAKEIQDFSRPFSPPCLLLLGGETTVTLQGRGKGGRNQELAYAFALEIEDRKGITLLSGGTDGTDGPTDAAGGMVDGKTIPKLKSKLIERMQEASFELHPMETQMINPKDFLENNDSYHALELAGDLLITGPTGTNVNDLVLVYIDSISNQT